MLMEMEYVRGHRSGWRWCIISYPIHASKQTRASMSIVPATRKS